jgi:hypothetical protein
MRDVNEIINDIMNDKNIELEGTYKKYFIVMNDYDTFILKIYDNVNRPNNMDNDDVIKEYMTNNYYGHSYEVIEINNEDYQVVEIK